MRCLGQGGDALLPKALSGALHAVGKLKPDRPGAFYRLVSLLKENFTALLGVRNDLTHSLYGRKYEMNIRFFEIMFFSGFSMIIKALREPTIEEAKRFVADDMKMLNEKGICFIEEWSETDARTAFDFDNEENWPIFGA